MQNPDHWEHKQGSALLEGLKLEVWMLGWEVHVGEEVNTVGKLKKTTTNKQTAAMGSQGWRGTTSRFILPCLHRSWP